MIYLTSTNEAAIIAAEAKISLNCEFPSHGTQRWDVPQEAINQNLWFILKPLYYNQFTQEQMMNGVDLSQITELEYNENWFAGD